MSLNGKTNGVGTARSPRFEGIVLVVASVLFLAGLGWLISRDQAPAVDFQPPPPLPTELSRSLIKYAEAKRFVLPLREARGLAVAPDGALWAAGDMQILRLNAEGVVAAKHYVDGLPYTLAVARDGTLYVGMERQIAVYDRGGKFMALWSPFGTRSRITALALGQEEIWVADAGGRAVWHMTSQGDVTGQVGARDTARKIPGLVAPSPYLDVAVAGDGTIWVANPGRGRMEAYSAEGVPLRAWGELLPTLEGFSGCCNPAHFALLPGGQFVISEKGSARVKVYDAKGIFVGLVADPETLKPGPAGMDVAADAQGRIYLLDPRSGTVYVYERKDE
ncbi:MAG: NHL repeat-containing protein [Armatimonadota bacterium]